MPAINNVSVTNVQTGVTWVTGQYGTAPNLPLPVMYNVYVNATAANQPPVGFLNNPAHDFVVQGQYVATGQGFVSGLLNPNGGMSDPPLVFVFSS
jgi:hypothetical protein